jgi:hypothetical protein
MAEAFGLRPEAMEVRLGLSESKGGNHFWIVCCSDLMRHYAQIKWKESHRGKEMSELAFKADIQKAWLDDGPFDQFIKSHLEEIREEFMKQYAEFV